jgi:hypothetical protein
MRTRALTNKMLSRAFFNNSNLAASCHIHWTEEIYKHFSPSQISVTEHRTLLICPLSNVR